MKRDWLRLQRAQGLKPWLFPILAVLLVAVLFDQDLNPYLERREERQRLALATEAAEETLAQDARVKASHAALIGDFNALALRSFVAPDADAARSALQMQVQSVLQTLFFDGVTFEPVTTDALAARRVAVDAQFLGVPQQLPRLVEQIRQMQKDVRVERLEIRVVPDPQRNAQQLSIQARFVAPFLLQADAERATRPVAPASAPAAKAAASSPKRPPGA